MKRALVPAMVIIAAVTVAPVRPTDAQAMWRDDVSTLAIPAARAPGSLLGQPFAVDRAEVLVGQGMRRSDGNPASRFPSVILTLGQGGRFIADRQVVIFLALPAPGTLDGFSVRLKPTPLGPDSFRRQPHINLPGGGALPIVQGVHMRGKSAPGTPAPVEAFNDSYSVRLEFGRSRAGTIPGRLYLSTPDKAHSYVVGAFTAKVAQQ